MTRYNEQKIAKEQGIVRKKKEIPPLSATQKQAVTALYNTYKGLMLRTVRALTPIAEDREEIIQDSLIALMRNIDTISSLDRCKTAAYIVLTIRRTYYNRASKDGRMVSVPLEADSLSYATDVLADTAQMDSDARLDVMALMDALPPYDRMILEAWYLEGCSAEQLASKLNCKPGSIRMILSRVRKRAAKLMREMEVK